MRLPLSPKRNSKATACLKKVLPGCGDWQQVFVEIQQSRFLRGQRPTPGHALFRADFDWLLSVGKDGTENVMKVLAGKYRDSFPLDSNGLQATTLTQKERDSVEAAVNWAKKSAPAHRTADR